ncbi:hypothetical protein FH972_019071 [Carpinus fangiana]|uniref:Uncharacterized protein n=1 Tax=Carpinus fangiana TaxID=176857 RepID=A0A5N6RT82_9ROSI|nr:hypothetical protein FH972_019071 [Carpinus fangiana]
MNIAVRSKPSWSNPSKKPICKNRIGRPRIYGGSSTLWVVAEIPHGLSHCRLWVVTDCGLSPTKWGREGLVGCGLSPTVLVGAGLGGREREARMEESLGRRGKEEDGGEMRERKN